MKFRIKHWLVAFSVVVLSGAAYATEERLTDVRVATRADIERLADMGMDIVEVQRDKVTIVAGMEEMRLLRQAGFQAESGPAFADLVRGGLGDLSRAAADAGLYHTADEAVAEMRQLAQKYPHLARLEKIGQSFEKRDVYGLRIGAATKKVPKLLLVGLHHSREWMSVEVPLYAARKMLADYGKDEKTTELLQNREVFVVPVMNPDGLEYSQKQSSYWRKNRNDNNGNKYKGVDPNRNYGYQWGDVGASDYPGSDTYHGTGPFSEPCNQNIKRLAEKEKFTASISFHSYSQLILYPFGYGYDIPCPDGALFQKLAGEMAAFNKYRPQNSADLYPAMGDSDDWLYGAMKCLAFTFELDRSFVPAESQIEKTCALNYPAIFHLLDAIGSVHAKDHPDHVSSLRFLGSRLAYQASLTEALRGRNREAEYLTGSLQLMDETRRQMMELLKPGVDADGASFRELLTLTTEADEKLREVFFPLLAELRGLYRQELAAGRMPSIYGRRLQSLETLIP